VTSSFGNTTAELSYCPNVEEGKFFDVRKWANPDYYLLLAWRLFDHRDRGRQIFNLYVQALIPLVP
jgi:hypothetical protein